MRSKTAPAGRVRLVTTLSVVSAVMVAAGGILVVTSTATHLIGQRSGGHDTSLGVALVVAGLAVGLFALLVSAFTHGGRSRGSARHRPAGHRHRAAPSAGPRRERGRVLNPTTVYSPGGLIDVPRDVRASASEGAARASGFSDPPGAARPPGSHDARGAFKAPTAGGAPRGGPNEARPSAGPGRMGAAPPRPRYQAGAHPAPGAGPGWGPPGPAGRPPQQPMPPPHGRMRPGEAFPPREAFPARETPAARHGFPSGEAPPSRDVPFREGPPREAPPREAPPREAPAFRESPPPRPSPPPRHGYPARDATPPREPWRPDASVPPFEAGYPSRSARPGPFSPGPESGTGRPAAGPGYSSSPGPGYGSSPGPGYGSSPGPGYGSSPGPGYGSSPGSGYGPSAGRRPAPPGAPGGPGRVGPDGTFDGGYAQVIRPADHPARPNPGRPADPARPAGSAPPADRDVYVYRDVSDPAPEPPARHAAADDAAYWYDLLAEDPAPQREEARGPFEPLLSSDGTPGAPGPAGAEQAPGQSAAVRDEHTEPPEQARARRLEQLKDLYLTAEAIGEQNVDKHFDQLLAQQRELISEYFRQSPAAQPGRTSRRDAQVGQTEPGRQQTDAAGGQATPPEGVSVRAEPPHAW